MTVMLSMTARDAMLRHAAGSAAEVCGLLLGQGDVVERVLACANVHPDPARFFELDPAALFAAHRAARGGGPGVIGHYHSHPSGRAEPSPRDAAAAAADGAVWIVIAGGTLAAFRAVAAGPLHGRFAPLACHVTGEPPQGASDG